MTTSFGTICPTWEGINIYIPVEPLTIDTEPFTDVGSAIADAIENVDSFKLPNFGFSGLTLEIQNYLLLWNALNFLMFTVGFIIHIREISFLKSVMSLSDSPLLEWSLTSYTTIFFAILNSAILLNYYYWRNNLTLCKLFAQFTQVGVIAPPVLTFLGTYMARSSYDTELTIAEAEDPNLDGTYYLTMISAFVELFVSVISYSRITESYSTCFHFKQSPIYL